MIAHTQGLEDGLAHPGRHPIPEPALARLVPEMERLAAEAESPQRSARLFNLAGDVCLDRGDRPGAIRLYGQAIDALLLGERLEPAAATCRKVICFRPTVVRARCTLAWLALATGHHGEARREVVAYSEAAGAEGLERLALPHLRFMGEVCEEPRVREAVADALRLMNDVATANRLLTAPDMPPEEGLPLTARQEWHRVVELLRAPPAEL